MYNKLNPDIQFFIRFGLGRILKDLGAEGDVVSEIGKVALFEGLDINQLRGSKTLQHNVVLHWLICENPDPKNLMNYWITHDGSVEAIKYAEEVEAWILYRHYVFLDQAPNV